jgi:pyruvate ferredoxin oxidoreductase beta subunit
MSRLKRIARNQNGVQPLGGGHALCQGCGAPAIVRTVLSSIETPVIVVNATGCLEVATSRYPITAWNVPWMHTAFENTAAVASGVEAAFKVLKRRGTLPGGDKDVTIVAFGGDGGTYDIGLQSLSGAMERGHDMVYVCYDNGAYMNTGIQRSSATPFHAWATTAEVGKAQQGKMQRRKDLTSIIADHNVPYAAQASISHWKDLTTKAEKAFAVKGPAFINVLSPCPRGWRTTPSKTIEIAKLAVQTGFWPLFEVEDGHWRQTVKVMNKKPIEEFLKPQGRFKHLFAPDNAQLLVDVQAEVDRYYDQILNRCACEA